jgi:phage-related minor tail protein
MSLDLGTLRAYLDLDTKGWASGFGDAEKKLQLFGQDAPKWMSNSAGAIAAGGLVAAGLLVAGIKSGLEQGINADAAMAKLSAQLGLTSSESERIGKIAGSLYASAYGESIDDVTGAMQSVISGIEGMRDASDEALSDMTAKAMNFGSAFELDVARSTQVVGQMIKTGLVKDANEGFDLLTATMQKVPLAVREDILDAADEYGPFFASIGMDGDQAFNLLAKASEKGMYGIDKTGDALKEFTIRATDMSTASAAGYDALGLSQDAMSAALLEGGEAGAAAFDTIVGGLLGMTDPVAQSQAALALFGTPLEDLSTGEIPQFLASLQDTQNVLGETAGAADAMGETLNGSIKTGWTEISRTWDTIIGQVGTALMPVLAGLTSFLLENPALMQIFAAIIGVLALSFVGLTIATWAMNTALLVNPITWIVLAVVALIAAIILLIMNWDAVMAFLGDTWNGFVGWFTGVLEGFGGWWNEIWAGLGGFIQDVWAGFVGFITDVWNGFVGWVQSVVDGFVGWWNGIWGNVATGFTLLWQMLVSFVTTVFSGFLSWINSVVSGFVGWWNGVWSGVSSFFADLWNGIVGFVTNAWNNVMSFLQGIPGKILGVFAGAGRWLYDIGSNILQGLWDGLTSIWSGLVGWITDIGNQIADTFAGVLGIHSPSRVFREFGVNTLEGYIDGLDKMSPKLDRRMTSLVRTPEMSLAAMGSSSSAAANQTSRTVNYYAAEGQSLSSEEALFSALSSPRTNGMVA